MNASLDTVAGKSACCGSRWLWPPLIVALLTVAGSLALSLHLGLKACPLCFYQRTFAMSAAAVLLMGAMTRDRDARLLGLLVWPLAAAGLSLAAFHVYLEAAGKLECPAGLAGFGSAPQQSLAAYGLLLVSLLPSLAGKSNAVCCRASALLGGAVLGGLMAYACVVSSPPPQQAKEPNLPLDGCRVPYAPSAEEASPTEDAPAAAGRVLRFPADRSFGLLDAREPVARALVAR